MSRQLTTLTFNVTNVAIRHETLHGREYVVAPMVMLTEGVHSGSGGPLLYKGEDIKRAVPAWNMKPIVVYHPQINGQGASACDPTVLETQQVGIIMNTRWDGKLRAEAWVEKGRADKVDSRVLAALEENKVMEVSTGLFTENVDESGEWGDEHYDAIATNHQPDHLALLPDQIGACSVADGAGLLQLNETAKAAGVDVSGLLARQMDTLRRMVGNAMSHNNIYSALLRALRERLQLPAGQSVWVADVYDSFVVYEVDGDGKTALYSLDYTTNDTGVTLSTSDPVEVVRITEYRTPQGEFVGNEARTIDKEPAMNKKEVVDGLIANKQTHWGEDDRKTLMGLSEDVLGKLAPVTNSEEGGTVPVLVPEPPAEPEPTTNTQPAKVQTAGEYIAGAPKEIRELLTNSLIAHEAQKAELVKVIVANKRNKFTPEFLATKDLQELQGLAALAREDDASTAGGTPRMLYEGAATPAGAPVTNTDDETPLVMPVMNFEEKQPVAM